MELQELGWRFRTIALSAILLATVAAGPPAVAGSFEINPVNLAIPVGHSTTSLKLKNSDSESVAVRVITYLWTQDGGEDVYTETSNVIVSPPIFTIEPGKTQVVRVGLRSRRAGESYRVVVEEIPRPNPQGTQIQVALRLDLPLYVLAKNGEAEVNWRAWRGDAGNLVLEANNTGTRHEKILEIGEVRGSDEDLSLSKKMGVILPSSSKRWTIENYSHFKAGSSLTLKIREPAGEIQQQVVVEQR